MLELQKETKGDLIALKVSGKVTKEDYERMIPMWKTLIEREGDTRWLIEIESFEGYKMAALPKELSFDLKFLKNVKKVAVVGGKDWEEKLTQLAKPFMPGPVKWFEKGERQQALAWLGE